MKLAILGTISPTAQLCDLASATIIDEHRQHGRELVIALADMRGIGAVAFEVCRLHGISHLVYGVWPNSYLNAEIQRYIRIYGDYVERDREIMRRSDRVVFVWSVDDTHISNMIAYARLTGKPFVTITGE